MQKKSDINNNEEMFKIAYVVSKFPKISETFIIYEILYLLSKGVKVEIFPLVFLQEGVRHKEVQGMLGLVHYCKLKSLEMVEAQLYWLTKKPLTYFKMWLEVIIGNISSIKFLSRALVVVPLAAIYARKMLDLRIDHIHAHWASHSALTALCIKKLCGLTYSFTAHAHDIYVLRNMLEQKITNCEMVVTISEYNKNLLETLYGKKIAHKIQVVRCGIDTNQFKPPVKKVKHKIPFILCIGSLEEYKGHQYLLSALKILKERKILFRCVLVGQGILKSEIEDRISQLELKQSVCLSGALPQHKVRRILATASIYVQPSIVTKSGKMEGIPVSLMEALAMEIPVISSRISGIPELVQNNVTGLIVEQKNAQSLANAIERLIIDDELAKNLAINGRARVLEQYNLTKNASMLFNLLKHITDNK